MAEPFQSAQEYIRAVLQLVDRRLVPLEEDVEEQARLEALVLAGRVEERIRSRCLATVEAGGTAPLDYLFRVFGLTSFERHCVYLALAPELDASYGARYAALQPGGGQLPGLELCLHTFAGGREELLRQWRGREELLSCFFRTGHRGTEGGSDLTCGLKLDRRILSFLFDYNRPDPALEGMAELFWPGDGDLTPLVLYGELAERMAAFAGAMPEKTPVLFYLKGQPGAGRRTLARHFCQGEGRPLLLADLAALFRSGMSWKEILLHVCREAVIRDAALGFTGFELLLDGEEEPPDRQEGTDKPAASPLHIRLLLERAAGVTGRLFLLSDRPWQPEIPCAPWQRIDLELDVPHTAGRLLLWQYYLAGLSLDPAVSLETLAIQFALQPGQIRAAAEEAKRLALWEGTEQLDEGLLRQACRGQLSHNLGKTASRVNAAYTWEDLILPPEQKVRLQNACAQVEYRHRVYDQWGFGKKVAYGRGLSMLFTGPPGTGKTMAAQVIANRLGLELYKVDLSGVLSKYIGETEKQLGAVFDEVKKSQSILFFDEADALFGKRSETKDSHDRYANVQTSYLLQKMEEYDGIVILASNFLQNFDEAFKRRIKFIIDFTLPDRERREKIWRSVLPPELPRDEDIDLDFLARSLELSGSSIKNIAVSAAFLAAEEGAPMGMVHLLLAAQAEQNKTGKNLGREDLGEYYFQVQAHRKSRLGQEGL